MHCEGQAAGVVTKEDGRRSQTEAPSALRWGLGETSGPSGGWGRGTGAGLGSLPEAAISVRTTVSCEEAGCPLSRQPDTQPRTQRARLGAGRSLSPSEKRRSVMLILKLGRGPELALRSSVGSVCQLSGAAPPRPAGRAHAAPPSCCVARGPASPGDVRGPSSSFTVHWSESLGSGRPGGKAKIKK